ncbi:hypothetical protein [Ornithinibacillus scapharcae]|uniref:hypothetical protein n=1 Tax=Ornithinibacillus scapharcae TaxID=1147159 RepID=UPI001ED925F2|nr:hypothetical protein [Ornithinibacillus scapharcae]
MFLFFILVVPVFVLLHEIGHGIGALLTSKADIHIYLGQFSEDNIENFKLGRFHLHIQWSNVGYAYWGESLEKHQKIIALASGPLMSLFLALLFGQLTSLDLQNELRQFFSLSAIYNFFQFIITIIPITYPRWMAADEKLSSDGLQIIHLLRK